MKTNPIQTLDRAILNLSGIRFVCLCLIAAIFTAGCFPEKTETGQNVDRVDWLPSSATRITYQKRTGHLWGVDYECSMPAKDFEAFAAQKKWPMKLEENYYTSVRQRIGLPPLRHLYGVHLDLYPTALVYKDSKETGWFIEVIYDPDRQVLFVHENSN